MIEFRDALTDLLDEFGTDDGGREEDKTSGKRNLPYNLVFVYLVTVDICCIQVHRPFCRR